MRLAKFSKKHTTPSSSLEEIPAPNLSQELVPLNSKNGHSSRKREYRYSSRDLVTPSPEPRISPDHSHFTIPIFTVYSALYHNGIILGIPCATAGIHRSQPAGTHIPAPLRPIQIQLDQVHYSFIDRMPQKVLRHNMISLSDDFNVEDFTADLFTMPSFIIKPGCQSWDPTGWSIASTFRAKWSVLFNGVDSLTPTAVADTLA
jgi:hypothetical protein